MRRYWMLFLTFLIGCVLWALPTPAGMRTDGWHLLIIFLSTLFGIIAHPLPMGCMALISLGVLAFSKTVPLATALSGFSHEIVWLIVCSFFIARGFIKTGLGSRLAYHFMRLLGKRSLGLGYGLVITDLVLAPAIPSATARAGGVILPILEAVSQTFDSFPHRPSRSQMGAYLTQVVFQSSCVTSAMFVTAMAGNPLVIEIAKAAGVVISWVDWAIAALVPGLISLLMIPFVLYKLYPPEIHATPYAADNAREHLQKMGPVKRAEWIMLGVFVVLILFWAAGKALSIAPTTTALLGLVVLLISGVLDWNDIRKEEGAWETLIWFSVLIMLASQLNEMGVMAWLSAHMKGALTHLSGLVAFLLLSVIYFYAHYFFASSIAHISAMFSTFLLFSLAMGAPPGLAVFLLAFYSSLFACLTHYGSGPAAVLFGAGYVSVVEWWKLGFWMSLVYIVTWTLIGGVWWKILGIW